MQGRDKETIFLAQNVFLGRKMLFFLVAKRLEIRKKFLLDFGH
jgi:hypothetical protein